MNDQDNNPELKAYMIQIDIEAKKRKCQIAVTEAIKEFENQTGLEINSLVPVRKTFDSGMSTIVYVDIDIVYKTKAR